MAEFFGFEIKRKEKELGAVTPPATDDGTYDISGGGFYSTILDTDGRSRTEDDLIRRYRDIAIQPECDSAIELAYDTNDTIEQFDIIWRYDTFRVTGINL